LTSNAPPLRSSTSKTAWRAKFSEDANFMEAGLENAVCRRDGVQARRYTFELKPKSEEALKNSKISG
jgi:hypothetical protein